VQRSFKRAACVEADQLSKWTRCKACTETRDRRFVADAFCWLEELNCDMRLHAARAQQLCFLCSVSSICAVSCDWQLRQYHQVVAAEWKCCDMRLHSERAQQLC
jgi:hypothetical protein